MKETNTGAALALPQQCSETADRVRRGAALRLSPLKACSTCKERGPRGGGKKRERERERARQPARSLPIAPFFLCFGDAASVCRRCVTSPLPYASLNPHLSSLSPSLPLPPSLSLPRSLQPLHVFRLCRASSGALCASLRPQAHPPHMAERSFYAERKQRRRSPPEQQRRQRRGTFRWISPALVVRLPLPLPLTSSGCGSGGAESDMRRRAGRSGAALWPRSPRCVNKRNIGAPSRRQAEPN